MAAKTGSRIRMSATPLIIFAHLLVIAVTILILVWLLSFREGIAFESRSKEKIFNLHPLLMAIGFVLVAGEALMTYKTVPEGRGRERFYLILHCVALVAGTIGIYAAFKFHNELSMPNMNTFHSWIGMSTFCLFGSQFLLGVYSFMFPSADARARSRTTKRHMFFSVVVFLMAIISAETGLVERFTFLGLPHRQKDLIMSFTGHLILLSGAAVIVRTRSRMVQALVCTVIFLSAILSAEFETVTHLTLRRRQEAAIINNTGILILLYGVAVCLALILPGHQ
ncbi:hypothetical protein DCAR_0727013 [Daucus carota subsp. sativus]|uniref:ascorbate ferrireductase (transmembrane) n=2 Tax=Daucus carota subsp. sativus TaxID=79200 RepID=A0AAF1B8V0_DAUCS|nr:PREDICTED: probable ascorbate-specific transmembrane electron transporter 1 [Daucus carota subsp. sativus]WOH07581.1 hypothetical protein DCAR_0727013 [Daucus carota subsp. sativus]